MENNEGFLFFVIARHEFDFKWLINSVLSLFCSVQRVVFVCLSLSIFAFGMLSTCKHVWLSSCENVMLRKVKAWETQTHLGSFVPFSLK